MFPISDRIKMEISYIHKNNFVFNANALVKLFIIITFLILSFLFTNPIYLGVIFLCLILISLFASSFKKCLGFMRYFAVIALFLIFFNLLLNKSGDTQLLNFQIYFFHKDLSLGFIIITLETIIYSLISILQLGIMMFSFALMNIVINPDELMQIFSKLRAPYVFTLILSLTIRFFPLLNEDLKKISDVQKTRGFELEEGNVFSRIKNRMVLLLPLLANSLERSVQVSEALEARAFAISKKKVFFRTISTGKIDVLNITINLSLIGGLMFAGIQGFGVYNIYPLVTPLIITVVDIVIWIVTITAVLLIIILMKAGGIYRDTD